MKKSLVFGILLSICMTIPTMADTSNSGIVIEPISSLQEQLEEMTEEQKVIAIEKYYSVEDEKIVETRASWYQLGGFYMPQQSAQNNCVAACCYATMRWLTGIEVPMGALFGGGAASLSQAQSYLNSAQSANVYVAMSSTVSLDAMKANFYTAIAGHNAPPIISATMSTADGWPYALNAHAMCNTGITSDRGMVMVADSYIPWVNGSASTQYVMPSTSVKSAIARRGIGYIF